MISISSVLLPVAFSEPCLGAARYAESLACRFGAELILLHVVADSRAAHGGPKLDLLKETLAQSTAQLETFLGESVRGLTIRRIVLPGDPAREIVEYAHRERVDLIVMPTHGYGPFRRLLLGSVTAKVLHDADCPVWTGPHLEAAPVLAAIGFHNIVCALDFGPQTRLVLGWAAALAREFGANLAIVHVIPGSEIKAGGLFFDPECGARLAKAAQDHIGYLKNDLHITGEVRVEEGNVPAAVSHAAQDLRADLLVIGRGYTAGLMGRLRTNAYAILRESPCPVLSI